MNTQLARELGLEFPIFAFTHCRDVAAAVSKAVWHTGTPKTEWGVGPSIIDQQQAGMTTMVLGPMAFMA